MYLDKIATFLKMPPFLVFIHSQLMTLLAVGINYNSAPIAIRERLAFPAEILDNTLKNLWNIQEINEAAILSTCNRTEFYYQAESEDQTSANKLDFRNKKHTNFRICPLLYSYKDSQSIRHMFRVACGLDSMILGEPQILGQMKTAYHAANQAGTLGRNLGQTVSIYFFSRQKSQHRHRNRLQSGFGRLRRGTIGAANFRQTQRTNRAI